LLEFPYSKKPKQRKALISAINHTKREIKTLELKIVEPSPVKRFVKKVFGGPIKLDVNPEVLQRGHEVGRRVLGGVNDEIAKRLNVDEATRQALKAYELTVWSTAEEYRTKRASLLKQHHPDHGGQSDDFQEIHKQSKLLDKYFGSTNSKSDGSG
jgi:hypothetical protein